MIGRLPWIVALLPLPLQAAPAESLDLLNWLLSSLLVIGLLLVCAWLLKKSRGAVVGRGQLIRLQGIMAVGGREKVVLVQVGGQQYLLGVTPQQISLLDKLDEPLPIPAPGASMPAFSSHLLSELSKVLGRHEKD